MANLNQSPSGEVKYEDSPNVNPAKLRIQARQLVELVAKNDAGSHKISTKRRPQAAREL